MTPPTLSLDTLPPRVRIREIAIVLSLCEKTVRGYAKSGLFGPAYRVGPRLMMFDREAVLAFANKREGGQADAS